MAITLTIIVLLIFAFPAFFAFAPQVGRKSSGDRLQKIQGSPGYKDRQFRNVIDTSLKMRLPILLKTIYEIMKGGKDRIPRTAIETVAFNADKFNTSGNNGNAAITWFGHSSLLIKLHGKVFLTDPVLVGKRASMVSFMGPERFAYTHYIAINELPNIDAVLLSHDHYDHLDYQTILALKARVKQFIVPLGVGAHLERWGVQPSTISEYDWWDRVVFDDNITLISAPSRHFSGRALTGRNSTLWCSWIIFGNEQRIYFGADSGYSPSFKEIGEKYGPFDLTILECGAYSQYWPDIHMMPEETLQAHLDLKGRQLMPIHWGKFSLSLHGWKEPIERLTKKAAETGVRIFSPRIGAVVTVNTTEKFSKWWEM